MVLIELAISLEYEVEEVDRADFVFNIHPATTAHQTVQDEHLEVSGDVPQDIAADSATATRFMRLHAGRGLFALKYGQMSASITTWLSLPLSSRCRSVACRSR